MRYWRDPGYWRYLWEQRVSTATKVAFALIVGLFLGAAGLVSAKGLNNEPVAAEVFTTTQLETVVRKIDGKTETVVIAHVRTVASPPKVRMLTVVRNGRTVTIPAETVVKTDTVKGPTVTNTRTDTQTLTNTRTQTNTQTQTQTQTNTQTVDHPTTTTQTYTTTETASRDVPGPIRTETSTQTQTQTQTVTSTVNHTTTETVTVTEKPPPPPPP